MSRYALMPQALWDLRHRYTDAYQALFKEAGFTTMGAETLEDLPPDADTALLFVGAHGKELLGGVPALPKQIKVVLYLGGAHSFTKNKGEHVKALKRADIILSGCNALFRKTWPEFAERFVFFPNFFAPHERYIELVNGIRAINRCLLSGHSSNFTYPLRGIIWQAINASNGLRDKVSIMRHPRWWRNTRNLKPWETAPRMGDDYARTLAAHQCALTTASRYKYALMKYFEVPAAGALLLANDAPDVRVAGLKAGKHFVLINKDNALETIKGCLANPEDFTAIRKAGTDYVRRHHSVRNRAAQLEQLLEELQ